MATKDQVIALHRKHPDWSAPDIAAALGCDASYVRATARRQSLRLPKVGRAAPGTPSRELVARLLALAVEALLELDVKSPPEVVEAARRRAREAAALYRNRERVNG